MLDRQNLGSARVVDKQRGHKSTWIADAVEANLHQHLVFIEEQGGKLNNWFLAGPPSFREKMEKMKGEVKIILKVKVEQISNCQSRGAAHI